MHTKILLALSVMAATTAQASTGSVSAWLQSRVDKPFQVWGSAPANVASWLPARNAQVGDDMICLEIEIPSPLGSADFLPRCYPFTSIYEFREMEGKVSIMLNAAPR